ncbi:hypothetical protein HD597_005632 [Nonomuraea thailandensis]|uniref:Uncharacterized protein n=1 Tax=Nonomuraea thailandensis TaxID=1188745 RepID=A0A9X2K2P4_9ACTN|nr:hypothetical protein [Nonomuraea thailandensis]
MTEAIAEKSGAYSGEPRWDAGSRFLREEEVHKR